MASIPTPFPTIATTITATLPPSVTPIQPPTITITPTLIKPEFILVFLPVNWKSGSTAFHEAAQSQADAFIRESKIGQYFIPKVVILDDGLQNASLSTEDLVLDILEFGLQVQAADRYVGLTDGDLKLDGDSNIVGWTSGGQAVVAENNDLYVVAHELGHTFGLCDEYSYNDWSLQNSEKEGGCPNPYPPKCSRIQSNEPNCPGLPTQDGRNSIMGPAGLDGSYGYNQPCLTYLALIFQQLLNTRLP